MKKLNLDVAVVAAIIGAVAAIAAALLQAGATIHGARIQAGEARPLVPEVRLETADQRAQSAPTTSPEPNVVQSSSPLRSSEVLAFEGFVHAQTPEPLGKIRLQIVEQNSSGHVNMQTSWYDGLDGNASLTGIRNPRGELTAEGTAFSGGKASFCYIKAVFTSDRRLEGEYIIVDKGAPFGEVRRKFFAFRA